jgi:hypothetical protein
VCVCVCVCVCEYMRMKNGKDITKQYNIDNIQHSTFKHSHI